MKSSFIVKGNIVYAPNIKELSVFEDSYLICIDGVSAGVYGEVPEEFSELEIVDYGSSIIIPGLVDLHLHAPQYAYRGMGMDMELLPWLTTYAFKEEAKYADEIYAKEAYEWFVKGLNESVTTRAVIFATLHVPATRILMDLLDKNGMHGFVGKVNMDRNSPESLIEETKKSVEDTVNWIKESVNMYEGIKPILTPRFIPSCTDELSMELGKIAKEYHIPVQSHLSENPSEIDWVKELCPSADGYGHAYEQYGMFGKDVDTIMAHCVHSDDKELERMKNNGVFVAHCPQSNMNISSGIAPVRKMIEMGLKIGLGTDVAGGAHLSMFRAITDAIQASKMRWSVYDKSQACLTLPEAFYMATKGGGSFFGKVGSFEQGYEFDAVVLDDTSIGGGAMYDITQRLERLIYLSDDRNITEKYIAGKRCPSSGVIS